MNKQFDISDYKCISCKYFLPIKRYSDRRPKWGECRYYLPDQSSFIIMLLNIFYPKGRWGRVRPYDGCSSHSEIEIEENINIASNPIGFITNDEI